MARAGHLRERVTFRRYAQVDDGYGNVVSGAPADVVTVWADVLERTGQEKLAAGALEAARLATLRVRSSTETRALTEADFVVARGVQWNIRSIAAVGRKGDLLDMLCETGGAT